jgi:predicted amidophosphoribosyltransferase
MVESKSHPVTPEEVKDITEKMTQYYEENVPEGFENFVTCSSCQAMLFFLEDTVTCWKCGRVLHREAAVCQEF